MTKLYGIIGNPVTHSFSPDYFNEKFNKLELDCMYERFALNEISELSVLLDKKPNLVGFNVTSPFKEAIIPYLTNVSSEVRSLGAVNTVVRKGDVLLGFNTDVVGFDKTIASLGIGRKGCLVLGTGGASKAVIHVLNERHMPYVQVSRVKHDALITYDGIGANELRNFPVVINTTPLGMMNRIDEKPPLPYHLVGSDNVLVDLVYKPRTTQFLKEGLVRGARVKNGFQMLIEQAEASWKIWSNNNEKL